jgi:hypothetical protein
MSDIRIVSPEFTVPVLDAPRLKPIDVSSGLESVASGLEELDRAHKITQVNDAQIGFTDAFRELDQNVRTAPWDQKQPLFDQGAAQIRRQYLDPVTGRQQRQALEPEFDRTLGIYQTHTAHDAFQAEAAHNIAAAGAAMGKIASQVAIARSPQEREMLVDQAAALNAHLAIGGFINDDQRQQANRQFLNQADVASVKAALDDPNRDPSALARTLIQRKQYFHLDRDQVSTFAQLARNEAIRRDGLAAADATVDAAVLQQQAPKVVQYNATSILTTGRPLDDDSLAVIDRLPQEQQPQYRAQIDGADTIFRTVGDLRLQSDQQMEKSLEQLRPLGDGVYNQAIAYANTILADRHHDPAVAVSSIPAVTNARSATCVAARPRRERSMHHPKRRASRSAQSAARSQISLRHLCAGRATADRSLHLTAVARSGRATFRPCRRSPMAPSRRRSGAEQSSTRHDSDTRRTLPTS